MLLFRNTYIMVETILTTEQCRRTLIMGKKICTACGQEVDEDHLTVLEDKHGHERKRCPTKKRFASLKDPSEVENTMVENDANKEDNSRTKHSPPQGGGPIGKKSQKVLEKKEFVKSWLKSGPIGINPESEGTKYLIQRLDNKPEVVEDVDKLRYWVRDLTEVKDIAVDEMTESLKEIDEEYQRRPPSGSGGGGKGYSGDSELRRELESLKKEMEQDEASQMKQVAEAKLYQKAEGLLDSIQPLLTIGEILGEEARKDPEVREAIKDIVGVKGLAKILKRTAEKKKQSGANVRGDEFVEEKKEIGEPIESERRKSPDERVQEAIRNAEEKERRLREEEDFKEEDSEKEMSEEEELLEEIVE